MYQRKRGWFITFWPAESVSEKWASGECVGTHVYSLLPTMRWMGYVIESSKNNGVHAHASVYYKEAVPLSTAKRDFGGDRVNAHPWIDKTGACARQYLEKGTKKGNLPIWCEEFGDFPRQGERTDWEDVQDIASAGGSVKDCLKAHPGLGRSRSQLKNVVKDFEPAVECPASIVDVVEKNSQLMEAVDLASSDFVPRRWLWIWSHDKGVGKTSLGTYLILKHNGLPCTFDLRSVLYAYDKHKILVWDIPRETTLTEEMFHIWEELSDGKPFLSTKYESQMKLVRANVVILSNHNPPLAKYGDRIVEIKLGGDPLI